MQIREGSMDTVQTHKHATKTIYNQDIQMHVDAFQSAWIKANKLACILVMQHHLPHRRRDKFAVEHYISSGTTEKQHLIAPDRKTTQPPVPLVYQWDGRFV